MKILIVEDDLDIMTLIRFHLRTAGFETVEATDGEEALKAVRVVSACLKSGGSPVRL